MSSKAITSRSVPVYILTYLAAFIGSVIAFAAAAYYVNEGRLWLTSEATEMWLKARSALTVTELKYLDPRELSLQEAIEIATKEYDLPSPVILQAILDRESSGGIHVYRFEPEVFSRRTTLDAKYSESERRMLASSHGVAHIMGYRALPDCDMHWSELYTPILGLRCAAKIMKANIESSRARNPADKLRDAFRRYNGSGPAAEMYAEKMMSKVGQLLFQQVAKGDGK